MRIGATRLSAAAVRERVGAGEHLARMTSTSTFQGMENRPNSSRVLRPPGGGSSNIFAASDVPSSKPHKMASNIFGPPEETSFPKRSNPPGGKGSGIFSEPDAVSSEPRTTPAGAKNSDIFGESVASTVVRAHPNKPKDANLFSGDASEELKAAEHERENEEKKDEEKTKEPTVDDHEPHLGPRPRSHNKVTQPPGGKSTLWLF